MASQHHLLFRAIRRPLYNCAPRAGKAYASTQTQKPKLIDLSREVYHRAPAHPFHPPVSVSHGGLMSLPVIRDSVPAILVMSLAE